MVFLSELRVLLKSLSTEIFLRLGRDGLVRWSLAFWSLLLLILVPIPSDNPWATFLALDLSPILFIAMALWAMRPGITKIQPERLFWRRLRLALGLWLVVRIVFLLVPSPRPFIVMLLSHGLYAGFFVALMLAIEDRPDRSSPFSGIVPNGPAVGLFVIGLLGYFVLVPAILTGDQYLETSGPLVLYIALDCYLIVRVAICWFTAASARWKGLYGGLWGLTLSMLVLDSVEALLLEEFFSWPFGLTGELIWLLPMLCFLAMAQLARLWTEDLEAAGAPDGKGESQVLPGFSPHEHLFAFSVIFPVIHLAGYELGLFDPSIQDSRTRWLLGWLTTMGLMGVLQYRRISHQGRSLAQFSLDQAADLARTEERLIQLSKRRDVEEALRISEEKFAKAFRASPDPYLITSFREGKYVDVNVGFEEMTGWRREEVIGRSVLDPSVWADFEERERYVEIVRVDGRVRNFETEVRTKQGEIRRVLISSEPIEIDGVSCLLSVVRNITESRRLEQQVLRAQRMDSIGTLAGGLAHDLNNLLTPIMMSIQLLGRVVKHSEDQRLLETLQTNAERATGVVRQVLTFARGVDGERRAIKVPAVLKEVETIVRETFPRTLHINFFVPDGLWEVRGDSTQLHQVLLNLCLNAKDAVSIEGHLSVSTNNREVDEHFCRSLLEARPGRYVVTTVEDDGKGVPHDVEDNIFEPFFTTKGVGSGTGLGLSTVAAIVKSHGGFLTWESEPGEGSSFSFWIPARHGSTEDFLPTLVKPEPRGVGQLILLIDDEPSIREVAQRMLEIEGYQVEVASDGAEGLTLYSQHRERVRLIILDMMMPLLDGPSTIEAIRRIDPILPILGISGLVTEADPSIRGQLQGFLTKPFSSDSLLRAVGGVLAGGSVLQGQRGGSLS